MTGSYLPASAEPVGELDFAEGDGSFHPVGPEVGGVWVDVDAAVAGDLRLARGHPLPVDILPAVTVRGDKVQQEGVHGIGVQPRDTDLEDREHPSKRKGRNESQEGCQCMRDTLPSPSRPSTLGRPALECPRGAENAPGLQPQFQQGPLLTNACHVGGFTLNHCVLF